MPCPRHHLFHFAHSFFSLHCLLTWMWTLSLSIVMTYKDWFGICFLKHQKEKFNVGLQISIFLYPGRVPVAEAQSGLETWLEFPAVSLLAVLGVVFALLLQTQKIWFASLHSLQSHHHITCEEKKKKQTKNPTKPEYELLTVVHKLLLETWKMCFHLGWWSKV